MFTINLIKEKAISSKYLSDTVAYLIAAILPGIAIVIMTLMFLGNTAVSASQKRQISKQDQSLAGLTEAVKMQEEFDTEKKAIKKNLTELSTSLDNYTQWSPILVEVVKTMPDMMVMTDIQLKRKMVQRKKSGATKARNVTQNTLSLSLSGNSQRNYDSDVREYGNRMRSSQVLKELGLEQISVSQKEEIIDGKQVVLYAIKCVLINN